MSAVGRRLWLRHSRPQFFLIYAATAAYHVAMGLAGVLSPDEFYGSASFRYVNQFASHEVWGVGYLAIAVLLALGVFRPTFTVARIGLAAGAVISSFRAVLLLMAAISGETMGIGGVFNVALIAALHYSQAGEPPINPASARNA